MRFCLWLNFSSCLVKEGAGFLILLYTSVGYRRFPNCFVISLEIFFVFFAFVLRKNSKKLQLNYFDLLTRKKYK